MTDTKVDESQIQRFKKAARETGTDMSKKEFSRMLGKIARAGKPSPKKEPTAALAAELQGSGKTKTES